MTALQINLTLSVSLACLVIIGVGVGVEKDRTTASGLLLLCAVIHILTALIIRFA